MNSLALTLLVLSAGGVIAQTFSTSCPTCHREITKATPLSIETNSIKAVLTAPDSGCSNYVTHVTLRCGANHTNRFRREFVLCEPIATEDITPVLPHAEIQPPVPLPTTNQVVTIRVIVEQKS